MSERVTTGQLSSQVTALHREVRELRVMLEAITVRLDIAVTADRVVVDERGVFLPGSGRLGASRGEVEHVEVDERHVGPTVRLER